MRNGLGSDRGVADLPMLLMVSAIVTAVALPIFWSAYEDMSTEMVMGDVLVGADNIFACSLAVLGGGVGSSMEMPLNLEGRGSSYVEEFIIGGPAVGNGSEWSLLIRFTLSGADAGHLTNSPPVRLSSMDGAGPVTISSGEYMLRIVHCKTSEIHYAGIELV